MISLKLGLHFFLFQINSPVKDCHIKIANITVLKRSFVRNSVTDNLIDRGAARLWELVVVEGAGVALPVHTGLVHDPVDLVCGDPGPDNGGALVQHLPAQSAGHPQVLYLVVIQGSDIGVAPELHL